MEDNCWWKMAFGGRQQFGERRPLVEDDLRWKTTFSGRRPSVEDDVWWKMTYGGRQPSVEDDFWWKTILVCCLVRFAAFSSPGWTSMLDIGHGDLGAWGCQQKTGDATLFLGAKAPLELAHEKKTSASVL